MKKIIYILTILFFSLSSFADNIEFTASSKSPVRVGERFRLTYSVNGDGENFHAPQITDFMILSGPNSSSNSSIQIINGKVSRNMNHSFSYILKATKEGVYTIPAATINVDGKKYTSNTIKVKVLKGNNVSSSSTSSTSSNSNNNNLQTNNSSEKTPYAFIKTKVSNKNPYIGEQVIVSYDLYYRVNISNYNFEQLPSYPGCWSQKISEGNKSQRTKFVDGVQYNVAEIFKEAVFPQKSGKITAKPMQFSVNMRVKSKNRRSRDPFDSFFDDPFFGNSQSIQRILSSDDISLNVKNIPVKGQPIDYTGAVGSFTMNASVDKTTLKANEAINLTIKINGTGNISLIDAPAIDFPPDFETYDPEISKKINESPTKGISGTKTFKYLLIPRVKGSYTINPIHFTYFDLIKKEYVTLSSPQFTFEIEEGQDNGSQNISYSASKEDIKYLGSDIHFIVTKPMELQKKGYLFFGSIAFWLWVIIPILLLITIFFIKKFLSKRNGNIALQKERKATRIAKKRLKAAEKLKLNNKSQEFYDEIAQAVWGYISDKFNLQLSNLSIDSVREKLIDKNIDDELIKQFISTLENCEYARFAPGDKTEIMENLYNMAQEAIIKTEKELK